MWMSQYNETPIKAAIIKLLLHHRRIFSNIEGINSYVDVQTWRFEPLVHEKAGISDYIQYRFHNIYQGLKKHNRVHIAQKPAPCENIYIYLRP